jgi:hypothetical protein
MVNFDGVLTTVGMQASDDSNIAATMLVHKKWI